MKTRELFKKRLSEAAASMPSDRKAAPLAVKMFKPAGANNGQFAPKFTESDAKALAEGLGLSDPIHAGEGIYVVLATITPELALGWLEEHNEGNRSIQEAHSERIAADIARGDYVLTHEALAFSREGKLQDGQHRLYAVVKSRQSIKSFVFLNVCDDAQRVIDSGKARTATEFIQMTQAEDFDKLLEGVLKRAFMGVTHKTVLTRQQTITLLQVHKPGLEWVKSQFLQNLRGIRNAPVMAAVLRAYYNVDLRRLMAFCRMLITGVTEDPDTDNAAYILREHLLTSPYTKHWTAPQRYSATCKAIRDFIAKDGSKKKIVPSLDAEIFLLPSDGKPLGGGAEGTL